jgi:2-polyprenyl-3-methyl-5-hydroxy-6-metoxy-1,4-benzoquinol methylase
MDYLEKNKAAWNAKTAVHIDSDFYDMPAFLRGETSLKPLELELLGDVSGKRILHLQCHFGQDTLSLSRMGAVTTGVDLSDAAIQKARELAEQLELRASFVNCDVYSLKEHLHEQFDMVFTSYGTIGWLPDLDKWADIVQHFLKPGGMFVMADFHPVVWMFDDHFREIAYSYFNTETIVEQTEGSYADRAAEIAYETVSWNHPTSEILQSLINAGLNLRQYREWDYSPYNCFRELREDAPGVFRIQHLDKKLPMVYGIVATK